MLTKIYYVLVQYTIIISLDKHEAENSAEILNKYFYKAERLFLDLKLYLDLF